MVTWLAIGALYLLVIGLFRLLGGIAAAADAIARWGRASTASDSPDGRKGRSHDPDSPSAPCPCS